MYANKEEAEKCVKIAEEAIEQQNTEKAQKFLKKAEKLFPTPKIKLLLENLSSNNAQLQVPECSTSQGNQNNNENWPREDLDAIERIRNCKNHYDVLGVSKNASPGEIKKAYKKLALRFHPDKNRTPGAAEAFKVIGAATFILSDPEKRKRYDSRTEDHNADENLFADTEEFEESMAEDLFDMMFGRGCFDDNAGGGEYVERDRRHFMFNILPILILLGMYVLTCILVCDPAYSQQYSAKYPVKLTTTNLQVPYFVKQTFDIEYSGQLEQLEHTVETEYVNKIREACNREKALKESLMSKAKKYRDPDILLKAENQLTVSCDYLEVLSEKNG